MPAEMKQITRKDTRTTEETGELKLTYRSPVEQRALYLLETLKREYPGTTTALRHRNPFELLIATILSAQTTDVQVNKVTPALFKRFPGPEEFAVSDIEEIESYIRTIGLYHSKARYIKGACQRIVEHYNSQVSDSMKELITLPGVARKTANIVLAHGFGKQEGIAVDTHVKRLSGRLGLSSEKTPEKIERDLMALIPQKDWALFSDLLIEHGRRVCSARKPECEGCVLKKVCPYPHKEKSQR